MRIPRLRIGLMRGLAARRSGLSRLLYELSERYVAAYRNGNIDPATNGEYWLMRALARFDFQTVFDVGANRGEWASEAIRHFPNATIHAFEILPDTFRHLAAVAASNPAIRANQFGLADKPGMLHLNVSPVSDKLSSLLPVRDLPYHKTIPWNDVEVAVNTGDAYCLDNGIDRIDLLKIDVEGVENLVIAGLSSLIESGRVTVIQFEYGQANILSHYLLHDYHAYFGRLGYRVGKLMPTWVDFKTYAATDEDFIGPNYIAVQVSRPDLIEVLTERPKG